MDTYSPDTVVYGSFSQENILLANNGVNSQLHCFKALVSVTLLSQCHGSLGQSWCYHVISCTYAFPVMTSEKATVIKSVDTPLTLSQ